MLLIYFSDLHDCAKMGNLMQKVKKESYLVVYFIHCMDREMEENAVLVSTSKGENRFSDDKIEAMIKIFHWILYLIFS